ncbi:MAG: DUF1573 domain-containing protein [Bacteroidales bacterium]
MKTLFRFSGILFLGIMLVGLTNNNSLANKKGDPILKFKTENNRIQLDTMYLNDMDDEVNLEIEFENKGDEPLVVNKVSGCCGTQVKDWTKSPISPGNKGKINIEFRVPPRPHKISRTVKAISNDPRGAKTLRIEGIVTKQEDNSINLDNQN